MRIRTKIRYFWPRGRITTQGAADSCRCQAILGIRSICIRRDTGFLLSRVTRGGVGREASVGERSVTVSVKAPFGLPREVEQHAWRDVVNLASHTCTECAGAPSCLGGGHGASDRGASSAAESRVSRVRSAQRRDSPRRPAATKGPSRARSAETSEELHRPSESTSRRPVSASERVSAPVRKL